MNINKMPNNISDEYKKFIYPQVEWWECIYADLDIRNITQNQLVQYYKDRVDVSMEQAEKIAKELEE